MRTSSPASEAEAIDSPLPEQQARKGWLAGLPKVPEPVNVDLPGVRPRTAFVAWIAVALAILVLGVGLNWYLTAGEWVPPAIQDAVVDPNAALGDTPVQFLTAHPFDLLTLFLFVVSVALLALSLVRRREDGGGGLFNHASLAFFALAAIYAAVFLVARHYGADASGLLKAATGIIVTASLAGLALAMALIARARNVLAARRHEIRAVGWILFAFHWAATGMYYYVIGGGDWANMAFAYAAVFLLAYFAYQEFVSRQLGEDNRSLRFLAGAIVIAATVWFAFLRVEFLSQWLIETVAVHTLVMLQVFGHDVVLGTDGRTGFTSAISYAETMYPRTVIIILACTAIQSMMIFVAAALAVDGATWARRLLTIAIVAPIVYVLNLLRNTGIIIMWADRWLETKFAFIASSDLAFSIAHNWIGKGGSLIALVLIAILVFRLMPQVLAALVGVLDLPRRRGPIEQHYRAMRGMQDDAPTAPAPEAA